MKKQKKEPVEKPQKIPKVKTNKITSTVGRKVLRVVLWTLVAFLLVKGVGSILRPDNVEQLQDVVNNYKESEELREDARNRATSFAQAFANEYYTFTGDMNSDYGTRVGRYLAKGVTIKEPIDHTVAATVLQANTMQITFFGDRHLDADVHLKVQYAPAEGTPFQKDVNIKVPLVLDGDKLAVESLPCIIPTTPAAETDGVESYKEEPETTGNEAKDIKETLNSFFPVYFTGNANELSYYVTPDSKIKLGINQTVDFIKIDAISTYHSKEDTKRYNADVFLTVSDSGQSLQERLFISLEKQGDKYYIQDIGMRP